MNKRNRYQTKNRAYTSGRMIAVKGAVLHSYRFAGNYLPILYKNCRLSSLHPKKKEQIKRRDFCTLLAPFLDV